MKLSKDLQKILLATLKSNAVISRAAVEKPEKSKRDEWGLTPDEYPFWISVWQMDQSASSIALCVHAKRTTTADAYTKAYHYLTDLNKKHKPSRLPYKSLTILIASDAQYQAGLGLAADEAFCYVHSEKGYFMDSNGRIGNYALSIGDLATLRVASDEEIEDYIRDLNESQINSILTHQYFGEIRQAALTAEDEPELTPAL
jgi:hypothetical protein